MNHLPQENHSSDAARKVLGYLNFSSGNREPSFFQALNSLFDLLADGEAPGVCTAIKVIQRLEEELQRYSEESEVFRVDDQAGLVLRIVREKLLPEYRAFHSELLFHQTDELIFNSLFLGKIFEAVLRQGSPWTEEDRIVRAAISELNDYIGYRPVPVLEGVEKHEPYDHEWVGPIPLYMAGIGSAQGKYQKVIDQALFILRETDSQILYEACFDVNRLQEVVLDPRAYDFDHPVNRKPNYHFGLWDPHVIDKDGFYRRFVVHQVTIDGVLRRIETAYMGESEVANVPEDELLYEAGAVLVGTMLMGSGVCGDTPQAYDSETSLSDLMPVIAGYRDKFYEQLVKKIPENMKPRIKAEERRLFQPFGGCRQNLNKQLAKRRAEQLQRMHLARIFARMGYFEAAEHQTGIIHVPSARIMTTIDCLITEAHFLIERGELEKASENLPKIEELVRRGIRCGAIVDPWTILGFGANYSLFHSVENSIHDHRIDDLIDLMEFVFDLYSRLQKEAAAAGAGDLQADLSDRMSDLAGWWDQYGSTEVSGLESFSGLDAWESTAKVSTSLAAWHNAGTAAGDVAFWNRHVDRFNSTKAYVLLAEALLDQHDPVASMALMMHWLSNSATIPLTEGDYSFHSISIRWMEQLWATPKSVVPAETPFQDQENKNEEARGRSKKFPAMSIEERWNLTRKFFDFTEANADHYWQVPAIELSDDMFEADTSNPDAATMDDFHGTIMDLMSQMDDEGEEDDDAYHDREKPFFDNDSSFEGDSDDGDSLYSAAYENVTYHDTTDDGVDDSLMDAKQPDFNDGDDLELANETERISDRLTFIVTLSKLWKFVTEKLAGLPELTSDEKRKEKVVEHLDSWLLQVVRYGKGLDLLLRKAATYKVPPPRGTGDSLLEYDRHRGTKEILLDRITWTHVDVLDAKMIIESFLGKEHWREVTEDWEKAVLEVNHFVFQCDVAKVRKRWSPMLRLLSRETILYVPTSRGGKPWAIVRCRRIQQAIMRLMEYAPRLGLITEAFQVLETVQEMEESNPISPGAITEFDKLVETATRAITKSIALSSKKWRFRNNEPVDTQDAALVDYMERIIEMLLASWLSHSRQIRISPIESMVDRDEWAQVKRFITQYGRDIFTQQNMGFGNLRAMLHQGVDNYLRALLRIKTEEGEVEMASQLLEDLERGNIDWDATVSRLELIIESIAENYSEYVDYNSTTTHSDHGDKLFMLLDMLRVQIGYERVSWNLKPVYWVHDAMIRAGCDEAALLWEKAVGRRSVNAAEDHLRHYTRLSEKYGMWLPSVHERLQERFVRPLQVDRMCGLVPKAMRQAKGDAPKTAFKELYEQIENFAKEPMGVGFEMPEWLTALQDEVMATRTDEPDEGRSGEAEGTSGKDVFSSTPHFEQVGISRAQLDKMLDTWDRREHYRS